MGFTISIEELKTKSLKFKSLLISLFCFILFVGGFISYKVAMFILSFWIIIFFSFYSSEKDVTKDENFQHVAGRDFEFLVDVFLFKAPWKNELDVAVPGGESGVPISIEHYLSYGENWFDHSGKEFQNPIKYHILGIIPKGTKFRVIKIIKCSHDWDTHFVNLSEILDGPFKGTITDNSYIYTKHGSKPLTVGVHPRYLKECEMNPTQN